MYIVEPHDDIFSWKKYTVHWLGKRIVCTRHTIILRGGFSCPWRSRSRPSTRSLHGCWVSTDAPWGGSRRGWVWLGESAHFTHRCTPIITAKLRVQTIHQSSVRKIEDHNKISGFADQINNQVVISRTCFDHVQASCPCCMFKLYIPAACPCWMSMRHIHTACPHCMFLLHIEGACQCCTSMLLFHAVQSVFTCYTEDLSKK